MIVEIEVNGRLRTVAVERLASPPDYYRVTVDGQPRVVGAVRLDGAALSLLLPDGASREVRFGPRDARGLVRAHLGNAAVDLLVNGRRLRRGSLALGSAGIVQITAPMPGKVLRVLATGGEEVAARQALVVVEAMKMENALSAPRAGRVKAVLVEEGQSVEAGRVLIEME
ncbi:MAG: biotin/lipoyl-binding protein [Luteitalea sp.]|nr:biotin/lipoyl-binding protein [Luteitalea sp.]